MNQGGTVRKRRRRNLKKVNGLSTIPYDEKNDNFNIRTVFKSTLHKQIQENSNPSVFSTGPDTRVRMTYIVQQLQKDNQEQRKATRPDTRITRDPTFHIVDFDTSPPSFDECIPENLPPNYDSIKEEELEEKLPELILDRPYFLDKTTMTRLKQILLLAICSGTVPWYFNSKTHRIERWAPALERLWKIQWYIVSIQTIALTVFQFYNFIKEVGQNSGQYREVFMSSVSVYWYVCAVYFNVNMWLYKEQIREYINTLFKFNKDFVDKFVISLEGYEDGGRLVINLSIPSNTSQVFASVALFLVIPYQQWYLFSYVYPKPWYWLIPGALQEFVVVGQVISNYILYQWILVAHSNSVEFWLREIHNQYESGYTKAELRTPKRSIETYRALQVLYCCFNACMAPLAIPMMKTHILTGLVPCGYVFIRSMNKKFIEEFPGILTYPICVIDCATAGFVTLSLAAQVYDLASGFIYSWSQTKHKDLRRILMSCPTLKIWVGRFYYVTVSTTITFFKVSWDYIISCIIAFPQTD